MHGRENPQPTRRSAAPCAAQDYVQLVADLIENGNEARQVDIAARLGVAQPTVAKMLTRPTVLPEPPRCRGV